VKKVKDFGNVIRRNEIANIKWYWNTSL